LVVDDMAGIELIRIEEAGLNALQTQRQLFYDGWVLRVSPGTARRARSVNAHFGSTLPLEAKIDFCEGLYAARGLPTLFRITPFIQPANLEAALVALQQKHAPGTSGTVLLDLSGRQVLRRWRLCVRRSSPVVFCPRGMLGEWYLAAG